MGRRLSKKILPCLALLTLFITYAFYEQVSNNYIYVVKVYFQKFTDLLYPYLYDINETINEEDLIAVDSSISRNFLCNIQNVRHNSKQALYHLGKDVDALYSTFEICENKDAEVELIQIGDVDGSLLDKLKTQNKLGNLNVSSTDEYYSMKLDVEYFYNKLSLDDNDFVCNAERYDRVMNKSELEWDIETHQTFTFQKNLDYTLTLNIHGYYYVYCKREFLATSQILYENVYYLLPRNMSRLSVDREAFSTYEQPNCALNKYHGPTYDNTRKSQVNLSEAKPNVLILPFDSVSFNHFRRIFPLTYEYLSNNLTHNIIYDHFNSVGSNTYPNMVPFLSGVCVDPVESASLGDERVVYVKRDGTFQDQYPYIWYEYEKNGYLTAFQEDSPQFAMFNHLKTGFRYRPTAYYGRPYWTKYYQRRTGPNMCHNGVPLYKTYFNLIETFIKRMHSSVNSKIPYFMLNFLTDYTHDFLAMPKQLDETFRDLLFRLETGGYFDNTLLMIMSDHGNRLKPFAYGTGIGKHEMYLPFLSVRLPKRLWSTDLYKHANENKHKLVSFYDLHQTLRHLLHLTQNVNGQALNTSQYRENIKTVRFSRGISLFEQIPVNRSCTDALIPDTLCTCFKRKIIKEKYFHDKTRLTFKKATSGIVNSVNNITESVRDLCDTFKLDRIQAVKTVHLNNLELYQFIVVLQPGEAWFEASFQYDRHYMALNLHGDIKRISAYGNQSLCVNDTFMRNYCFCKKIK